MHNTTTVPAPAWHNPRSGTTTRKDFDRVSPGEKLELTLQSDAGEIVQVIFNVSDKTWADLSAANKFNKTILDGWFEHRGLRYAARVTWYTNLRTFGVHLLSTGPARVPVAA